MNFFDKNIYFIGIGGIGMSAIARFFKVNGCFVAGYDLTETPLTNELEKEGIPVHFSDELNLIPVEILENQENSVIIYTPAIPKSHKQFNFLKEKNYKIYKRAQVLGLLSKNHKTIGIAGTHGKTTISSIVAHIFKQNNKLNAAFVGGILKNYKSNLVLGEKNENNWLILESDEFDRSFLNFSPNIALISAVDEDHLDIYENKVNLIEAFEKFASQTSQIVVTNQKVNVNLASNLKTFKYGIKEGNDFFAENCKIEDGKQIFDIVYPEGICENISLKLPGKVNIENTIAAFSVAFWAGINPENIKKSIATFEGIERRFDLILENDRYIYINDYAHHPEEIERLREAVEQFYPNRKITAIFQPHLFSRTKDFTDGFAKSLEKFDEILLMDIYPAREIPIEGVTSKIIFDKINNENKEMCNFENIINKLKNKDKDILLTIGAGSIVNLVEKITTILES
ncbi:MAG: UDP-N-acetylmuramate--L-alanine ligase [Bacteroidales bacterium]|nr:UDP-N-acetylmuramate--L-alanine ligase [Bacteroidales bacterium]